jgi:hypothetical protein
MKTCINNLLLVLGLTANGPLMAQQWCPTGAEWRYPYVTQLHPQHGTLRYTYEGDSLYQGEACQHFESRLYFPDQTQWGPWHSFTTTTSGVILFWNTLVSQFDTLVDFDAAPGMGWSFIGFQSQEYFITVQDTGVSTIDGIPLRYLVITSEPTWFGLPTDTIYERIGALNLHNFSPTESYFMESPTLNGVGCYRDEEMNYTRSLPTWLDTPCDIALSQMDNQSMGNTTLSVFPNPGEDQLSITPFTGGGQYRLLVYDESGRSVGEWRIDGIGIELNSSGWARGVYVLELLDEGSFRRFGKWVKQ